MKIPLSGRSAAAARAKWPMFMPDVAYRIEGLPQPKRRLGRTWAEVARDNFPAGTGIPPWAGEAYRPEYRPKVISLDELLAEYTEEELARYYY